MQHNCILSRRNHHAKLLKLKSLPLIKQENLPTSIPTNKFIAGKLHTETIYFYKIINIRVAFVHIFLSLLIYFILY